MCGVQAHYRLDYIVGNNAEGEKTCRACHWKSWARDGRNLIESYVHDDDLLAEASEQFELPRGWSRQRIRSAVEENGYELVGMTAEITGDASHHTMVVRCASCQRISVKRLGDIGWGCSCSRNQNRSSFEGRAAQRVLLKDSDSTALKWWDHQRNTTSLFNTATVNATRACHWICPDCGTSFQEKVSEMTRSADCSKPCPRPASCGRRVTEHTHATQSLTIRAADSPIGLAHDALHLRAGAHELLNLAQAAPQYPPAPEVVERIVATAQHPHGGEYTEIAGLPRLREAFASELSATYSGQVRPVAIRLSV
jgi:hypothetical protein